MYVEKRSDATMQTRAGPKRSDNQAGPKRSDGTMQARADQKRPDATIANPNALWSAGHHHGEILNTTYESNRYMTIIKQIVKSNMYAAIH